MNLSNYMLTNKTDHSKKISNKLSLKNPTISGRFNSLMIHTFMIHYSYMSYTTIIKVDPTYNFQSESTPMIGVFSL